MPKVVKRRRTIVIVGNPGHHNTAVGSQWLVAHRDTFFGKTALIINSEHTAQVGVDLYVLQTGRHEHASLNFDQWFANGSAKFKALVTSDWDRFWCLKIRRAD